MTEAQTSALVIAFNRFLEDSDSTLRITYPDAEKIAEAVDRPAFPTFDP